MPRHLKSPGDISRNTLAQRRRRERLKLLALADSGGDASGALADAACDGMASDALSPPGLIQSHPRSTDSIPGPGSDADRDESAASLEEEQALWVRRRREITELELAKRRGDLISVAEARAQSSALGRRIRIALDRIPQHLPAHLSPEHRADCERAIAAAVAAAMAPV